tara:strand:+ start:2828 stop:3307 length:480 start_codon:yes stop_codon:yes gene_type:complete
MNNIGRKIACAIVSSYKRFSDKMFDPDVLRSSFIEQELMGGDTEFASKVFSTWVDTVVSSVSKNKIDSQSDNILDLMSDLEEVIDSNFTEEEKSELVDIINTDVMKKILNTNEIYDVIFKSKKDMQSKIMNTIYSEENDSKWRHQISEMFPDIDFDVGQ